MGGAIEFEAQTDIALVLDSDAQRPYELFMGPYSVHTSADALYRVQLGIRDRAQLLRQQGRMWFSAPHRPGAQVKPA